MLNLMTWGALGEVIAKSFDLVEEIINHHVVEVEEGENTRKMQHVHWELGQSRCLLLQS